MFYKLFFVLLLQCICTYSFALNLKNGDLIFQESCSGDKTGDAIKNVTNSSANYHFTHVGIVYIPDSTSNIYVIEATPPLVRMVSLDAFINKFTEDGCTPISVVGRLKESYQEYIPNAINEALSLVGKEYDYGFILGNNKYYCSELIYDIFFKANNEVPLFDLNVMTFKQTNSNKFDENWIKYFKEKQLEIPEGQMGINPGAISLSAKINILGKL